MEAFSFAGRPLMGDPRRLRPDDVEIFVVRELRKAGLYVGKLVSRRPTPLSADDEWTMELNGVLRIDGVDRRVLVECRSESNPVGGDAVHALGGRVADAAAERAVMFATSGYEADAVREAKARGIPLLAVADGKAAFARSQGGMAGQPPAWVPEYMAEVVDLDMVGQPRHHLLVADRSDLIVDRFKPAAPATGGGP